MLVTAGADMEHWTKSLALVASAAREAGGPVIGVITPAFRFHESKTGVAPAATQAMLSYVGHIVELKNHRVDDFVDRDI